MSSAEQLQQSNNKTKRPFIKLLRAVTIAVCLASGGLISLSAQESWYKVELSIFSNEALSDREQEQWQADRNVLDYPSEMIRLKELGDLLLIDSLLPEPLELETGLATQATDLLTGEVTPTILPTENTLDVLPLSKEELQAEAIGKVGPFATQAGAPFKFLDFERDGYLRLPASLSDFAQTNRALRRSPEHRLLYHAVWRQAVLFENEAKAILIEGGDRYGNQSELQGSLTIRFNENSDRVVLDADIWLTEFVIDDGRDARETTTPAATAETTDSQGTPIPLIPIQWQLPELPATIADGPLQILENLTLSDETLYRINNVFHMLQNRAMRSNEFHYMDHPALGIVVQVEPYEVPALPDPNDIESFDFEAGSEIGPSASPINGLGTGLNDDLTAPSAPDN